MRLSKRASSLHDDIDPLAVVGLLDYVALLDRGGVLVEKWSAIVSGHVISSFTLQSPSVGVWLVWQLLDVEEEGSVGGITVACLSGNGGSFSRVEWNNSCSVGKSIASIVEQRRASSFRGSRTLV